MQKRFEIADFASSLQKLNIDHGWKLQRRQIGGKFNRMIVYVATMSVIGGYFWKIRVKVCLRLDTINCIIRLPPLFAKPINVGIN